jgi:hypothetical protein
MTPKPFGNGNDSSPPAGGGRTTGGSKILGKLMGDQPGTVGGKTKVPAYLSNDLLEELRDTVVGMQRDPSVENPPVSLSAFVEDAVQRAVEEARDQYRDGRRYPPRPNAKLKTGPPVG